MAGWSGFTDEDLRKIKGSTGKAPGAGSGGRGRQSHQAPASRKPRPGARGVASQRDPGYGATEVGASMKLGDQQSQRQAPAVNGDNITQQRNGHQGAGVDGKSEQPKTENNLVESEKGSSVENNGNDPKAGSSGVELSPEREVKELDDEEALSVELGNVQKFQQQQKVIEEANKHKRALLAKAIEDRRKKAKAEADKLVRVQQELNHLDHLLTADVGIIRDKIEAASLEYMDAQKRYERAEKEFITAKLDLYQKSEAKEALTEHLYTIIHQNEVRKAKKLVELMEKLAMEVSPEEMELTIPAIPQLSNYSAVATLHDPQSPTHPLTVAQQQLHQQQQEQQQQQEVKEDQASQQLQSELKKQQEQQQQRPKDPVATTTDKGRNPPLRSHQHEGIPQSQNTAAETQAKDSASSERTSDKPELQTSANPPTTSAVTASSGISQNPPNSSEQTETEINHPSVHPPTTVPIEDPHLTKEQNTAALESSDNDCNNVTNTTSTQSQDTSGGVKLEQPVLDLDNNVTSKPDAQSHTQTTSTQSKGSNKGWLNPFS